MINGEISGFMTSEKLAIFHVVFLPLMKTKLFNHGPVMRCKLMWVNKKVCDYPPQAMTSSHGLLSIHICR